MKRRSTGWLFRRAIPRTVAMLVVMLVFPVVTLRCLVLSATLRMDVRFDRCAASKFAG